MKRPELFETVDDVREMLSVCITEYRFEGTTNIVRVYDKTASYIDFLNPIAIFYFYKSKKVFGYGAPEILNKIRLILDEKDFDIR